jgi:hypothetical protein
MLGRATGVTTNANHPFVAALALYQRLMRHRIHRLFEHGARRRAGFSRSRFASVPVLGHSNSMLPDSSGILVIDPETGLVPRAARQGDDEVVVSVAGSGIIDAFEWTIVPADPSAEDRVGAAIEWLAAKGFEVPEQTPALLEPYLSNGMHLLALRLRKGSEAGCYRAA